MRVLAGLGALLFLYLAIIPAGLIYSTLDSACAGAACETSVVSRVGFTVLYGACLAAILGTAGLFAHYAASGREEAQSRLPRALALTGSIVGAALFVLFLVAFPVAGASVLALALAGYLGVRIAGRDQGRQDEPPDGGLHLGPPQPSGNGRHSGNGHRALRGSRR